MTGEFLNKIMAPKGDGGSKTAVYDCLYLDTNEGSWEYAETRITNLMNTANTPDKKKVTQENAILGFDIICRKEQIVLAIDIARKLFKHIDTSYPRIYARAIGITTVEDNRPLRELLTLNHDKFKRFLENRNGEFYYLFESPEEFEDEESIKSIMEDVEIEEEDTEEEESEKIEDLLAGGGNLIPERRKRALVYARDFVEQRKVPFLSYEAKFQNLMKVCKKGKKQKTELLVVAYPEVLGDNYEEVLRSLGIISRSGMALHIVNPE